jgi:molybdopterin-guanine dinucleotide biosynthesis protein A
VRSIVEPAVGVMAARVPVTGERRQPLCAAYGSGLGALVQQCLEGDDRSMAKLIAALETVEYVAVDERAMINVNTTEDLAAALRESGPPRNTR